MKVEKGTFLTIPQLWKTFEVLAEWRKTPRRANPKLLENLRAKKKEKTQNLWSTFRAIMEQVSTNILQMLCQVF